jgi:diguanylate cyclase (GGDEF)-like protein
MLRCNLTKNTSLDFLEGSLLTLEFPVPDTVSYSDRLRAYAESSVSSDDRESFVGALNVDALLFSHRAGKRAIVLEYREDRGNADRHWVRLTVELVEYPTSADIVAYMLFEDIDAQKRAILQATTLANTDALTGLLNRRAFERATEPRIKKSGADALCALLMIDLDRFKQLNDAFGHKAGDSVLVEVAQKLRGALQMDELACRFGGDEFMVFLDGLPGKDAIRKKAAQLCSLLQWPLDEKDRLSVSMGVAVGPEDADTFDGLYQKADQALYHVKGMGKNSFLFYEAGMEDFCRLVGDAEGKMPSGTS